MKTKLTTSAKTLEDAISLIQRLRSGTSWEGDAAVAFREELDGALPENLKKAHTSISRAAEALGKWNSSLAGYKDDARKLDNEARAALETLDSAKAKEKEASSNPDLDLANQTFDDDASLQNAQARLDKATSSLQRARDALDDAKDNLASIRRRGHDLESEHSSTANENATLIRDATDELAPEEPNWFTKAMDWLSDNLTDVLGTVAAIAGLLALILSGPVGVAFLLIAATASAATLTSRLSDPTVRASLKDGFTKGEFDADFWSNAVGVAGDALGMVPGVGAVARGVNGAVRSAGAATEALSLTDHLASAGSKTWLAANRIAGAENPLTTWMVKGAANPERAGQVIDLGVAGAGAATGTYGTAKDLFDTLDNDGVNNAGTGLDGARAGSFDGAGNGATAIKTLKVLLNVGH
ncbi:hypothetical protein [Streptomyces catenulae]|uniref:Chromosome partition protein Smc n=1 Tax=Streptomyces catenulae TaxID=66875 RepID=A0ABV2YWS6_9ACTN|nr:hypothetical protein [Streptomyces catenulae]